MRAESITMPSLWRAPPVGMGRLRPEPLVTVERPTWKPSTVTATRQNGA